MEPKYLYKILDEAPPEPIPEKLPATELDISDGFIHLSTAEQTPLTATLFFNDSQKLWILKLDRNRIDGRVEYSTDPETEVENGCAHVFDSNGGLGSENIVDVIVVTKHECELWDRAPALQGLDAA